MRHFLLLSVTVLVFNSAKAQTPTKLDSVEVRLDSLIQVVNLLLDQKIDIQEDDIFKIDIGTKSVTHTIGRLKKGAFYQIELNNINLNAYKVDVQSSDSVNSFSLKTPAFGGLPTDIIKSFSDTFVSSISTSIFSIQSESVDTSALIPPDPIALELLSFKAGLDDEKSSLFRLEDIILNQNARIAIQRSSAITTGRTTFSVDSIKENYLENIKQLSEITDNLMSIKSDFNDFQKKNSEVLKQDQYKGAVSSLETYISEFEKAINEAQKSLSTENYAGIILEFAQYGMNKDRTYTSLPIQFTGDETKVKIKLTPRDNSYLLNSYTTRFVIERDKPFYWGTGVSLYFSGLEDENYSVIQTDSLINGTVDTVFVANKEVKSGGEIGITSLLRFGRMVENVSGDHVQFGIHGSFGVGMNFSESVRPRFLGGLGVSLGSGKHAVSLDGGVIVGPVKKKSSSFNEGQLLFEKPESLTVSRLDVKLLGFVSLGYMLKL